MKELWDRLGRVRASRLRVEEGGTTREGSGLVTIDRPDPFVIEWEERGSWRNEEGRETPYHDRLRWTAVPGEDRIALTHLRRGHGMPNHLGDLVPTGHGRYRSATPHICGEDVYIADVGVKDDAVELLWQVRGPRKDYRLIRTYPSA